MLKALRHSAFLATAALVALAGCGSQPADGGTTTSPQLTVDQLKSAQDLPPDVTFVLDELNSLAAPTANGLNRQLSEATKLVDGQEIVPCDDITRWGDFKIPAVPAFTVTCGVQSPTNQLPERHGKTGPSGEPLEYNIVLTYSPVAVDASKVSAIRAYESGAVSVVLHYSQESWNGKPPAKEEKSDPKNAIDGGWAVGQIHDQPAIVQRRNDQVNRVATVVDLGGDKFSLSSTSYLPPVGLLTFVAALNFN